MKIRNKLLVASLAAPLALAAGTSVSFAQIYGQPRPGYLTGRAAYGGRSLQPGFAPSDNPYDRNSGLDQSPSYAHPEGANNGNSSVPVR